MFQTEKKVVFCPPSPMFYYVVTAVMLQEHLVAEKVVCNSVSEATAGVTVITQVEGEICYF